MNLDLQNPIHQNEETDPFNAPGFRWTQIGWTNQLVALPTFNSYWQNYKDNDQLRTEDRGSVFSARQPVLINEIDGE